MTIENEFEDQDILALASTSLRESCLAEAISLTCGDRNKAYGPPVESMAHIAIIFNAITGHSLTARDVALLHVATKLGRMSTSPTKRDHYVDLMAYSGIALECAVDEPVGQMRES